MARPSRPTVIALAGVVAVLAGLWLSFQASADGTGPQRYADYLPTEPSSLAGLQRWGVGLVVVGALLVTGVIGHRLARSLAGGPYRVRPTAVAVLGVILLAAGIGIWQLCPDRPAVYGWFAYAPLSDQTFTPPIIRMRSAGQNAGLVLAALGAVLVSATAGYRIGHQGLDHQGPDGADGLDRPLPPAGEPA